MTRVRVVGAGLSGLASAWFLTRLGAQVEIVEAAPGPGGFIRTIHLAEGPVETGANAFVWTPGVGRMFEGLGLTPQFARDASRRRYIFRDGSPRRWPLTPLETAPALARFGAAWAARALRPRAGESMEAWGHRVVGPPATRWMLSPALQGIYGAPAAALSAEAVGIGRRRGRVRLAAPRAGMGVVIDALRAAVLRKGATISCGQPADRLEPGAPAIVCTGAAAAAPLLAPHHPALAHAAGRVRSAPLVTATAFFEQDSRDIRGFGVLFPRGTARALGVLFNTEIFEDRGALRSERWIFGDPALVGAPDAEVRAAIEQDRQVMTGRAARILALHVTGWREALPVYDAAVAEAARAAISLPPWLGVCGNYLGRIGISALVERSEREARRIMALPR